ncbi:hypothetical protein [Mycobacterium ostraviense]|uniref:hypothetical protein n=1 Tax=Mycobacterium ostraviense TaxID=2738409 RepID=UPI000A5AC5EC|nr:hypothetical protein [Mycobacterium ostraviense]UGT91065.1 hypothetical protein LTS72_23070 [Mycobacterium ostraviense]
MPSAGDTTRGAWLAGSDTAVTSTSPVRVKVTDFLIAQPLALVLLISPASVPSGRGCSIITTQNSALAPWQVSVARPTASQWPPTSSNTIVGNDVVSPPRRAAVATQPVLRHTERTPHVVVEGFAPGINWPSRPGPVAAS